MRVPRPMTAPAATKQNAPMTVSFAIVAFGEMTDGA